MNLGEIKTALKNRLNIPDYGCFVGGETFVTEVINTAQTKLARMRGVKSVYTDTLSAGQTEITLPAAMFFIVEVAVKTSGGKYSPLEQSTHSEMWAVDSEFLDASNSTPTHWWFEAPNKVEIYPPAAGGETARVEGWKMPDDLSGATDSNRITVWFFDGVIEIALRDLMQSVGDARLLVQDDIARRAMQTFGRWTRTSKGLGRGMKTPNFRAYRGDYG